MTICVLGINFCSKPQLSLLFVHVVIVVVFFASLFVVVVLFFFTETGQDQMIYNINYNVSVYPEQSIDGNRYRFVYL